ncbi:diaminopropionate ammonia-lyase [Fusobacterium sp.]|uniref:diaminopropionate ammonia-lyase n=1 Tax=Fusobacterium sp. TaxID=68766 RepID=UPI00262FD365|nr:diaminopropionate ammonia-lyase [Fusobacterium sp.]
MSILKKEHMTYLSSNINESDYKLCDFFTKENALQGMHFIKTLEEYKETPLVNLKNLANKFSVKRIYVKDESKRMGLNAFKGIGVLYGVVKVICKKFQLDFKSITFQDLLEEPLKEKIQSLTFIAATDGNHGKGLAWVSKKLGCSCHIYMPKNTTNARVKAIENFGATVIVTKENYDGTLRIAIDEAKKNNWEHIQDQTWQGYTTIPNLISEGYSIIAEEVCQQMAEDGIERPTHILLQAGAGTFALGIMGYYGNIYKNNKPNMFILEPENANCYFASKVNQKYTTVDGDLETVMAGLSVGEPNTVAWEVLSTIVNGYVSCKDNVTATGMRVLGNPILDDERIVSGESGALGMGVLSMICRDKNLLEIKEKMNIDENSIILLISTEGNTDPEVYEKIIWDGLYSIKL